MEVFFFVMLFIIGFSSTIIFNNCMLFSVELFGPFTVYNPGIRVHFLLNFPSCQSRYRKIVSFLKYLFAAIFGQNWVHIARFLKYFWSFFNILPERVESFVICSGWGDWYKRVARLVTIGCWIRFPVWVTDALRLNLAKPNDW